MAEYVDLFPPAVVAFLDAADAKTERIVRDHLGYLASHSSKLRHP